jgi:hypothetical protein
MPRAGIAKLSAANAFEPHGGINVGIVFWTPHLNGQITSGKLNILVSGDALHR